MLYLVLLLTGTRAVLAPVVVALAMQHAPGWTFILCLVAGLLSDIYDGVVARRFGLATAAVRRLDSWVDRLFYSAVLVAAWMLYPEALRRHWPGLVCMLALSLCRHLIDFLKFKREASYHMWSAKLWGLSLFAAFVALLGFGSPIFVPLAIGLGIITYLEALAASLILRKWAHDLHSVFHAISLARLQRPARPGRQLRCGSEGAAN